MKPAGNTSKAKLLEINSKASIYTVDKLFIKLECAFISQALYQKNL